MILFESLPFQPDLLPFMQHSVIFYRLPEVARDACDVLLTEEDIGAKLLCSESQ